MVETDFSGDYVNEKNTKDDDVLEILGEGEYEEKEFKKHDGSTGMATNFNIPILNTRTQKKKIYTPKSDTGEEFQKAWGSDSKMWIGKSFKAVLVKKKFFGQEHTLVIGKPIVVPVVKM